MVSLVPIQALARFSPHPSPGYQHIRMYDLNSNNPNPVINYNGVSKNITSVGFHEDGRWMYTGGEDCMARIWDLRWAACALCSPRESLMEGEKQPYRGVGGEPPTHPAIKM